MSARHWVVLGDAGIALRARVSGIQVRDTLLVLGPGPHVVTAFLLKCPTTLTTVESALRFGGGPLHIDACRVKGVNHASRRWPTNLLLVHAPTCTSKCSPDCPVLVLDHLSGERPSTLTGRASGPSENPASARPAAFFGSFRGGIGKVYADSGGASRFYPQFATYAEAVQWLSSLVE